MSKKIAALILLLCIAALVYGCDMNGAAPHSTQMPIPTPEPTLAPEIVTATAVAAATATDIALPCATFTAPTIEQSVVNGVSFRAVTSGLSRIDNELNTIDWTETECAWNDAATFWHSLSGKTVNQWRGWVVATGNDSLDYLRRFDYTINTAGFTSGTNDALLVMRDPYSEGIAQATTTVDTKPLTDGTNDVILVLLSTAEGKMTVGQNVSFSGVITRTSTLNYIHSLAIPNAQVVVAENKAEQYTTPLTYKAQASAWNALCASAHVPHTK